MGHMATIVTTVGGSLSNSFATVEEADAILADAPFDTSGWDDIEYEGDGPKAQRLILAAQLMAFLPWKGYRVYTNQALCFPRSFQADTTVMLDAVKEIQTYLAWFGVHRGIVNMSDPGQGIDSPEIKSLSLGGFLGVTFASDALRKPSDAILEFLQVGDWVVYLKAVELMSQFRGFGADERPDLLEQVD